MDESNSMKFRCTWRIENFLYCIQVQDECIESPKFTLKIDEQQVSCLLTMMPRKTIENEMCLLFVFSAFVSTCKSDSGNKIVDYCLKLFDANDKPVTIVKRSAEYRINCYKGNGAILLKQITENNSTLLQDGTLVIQLEFPNLINLFEVSESFNYVSTKRRNDTATETLTHLVECLARTTRGIDKLSHVYIGQVNEHDFTSFVICSEDCACLCFKMKLNAQKKDVSIKVRKLRDLKSAFCTFKIRIYDSSGQTQHAAEYEHFYNKAEAYDWIISFMPKSYDSMLQKPITVDVKIKISNGRTFTKLEHGECITEQAKTDMLTANNRNSYLSLYLNKKACDFTLVSSDGKELAANKSILQASSVVFDNMLSHDTKELQENRVDMPDIDSETLDQLLKYIYSSYPEDLEADLAIKLYYAADKYEINNLKQHCSALMVAKLAVSNVLDVLKIADLHEDTYLKTFVKNFLIENTREVFRSDEWSSMTEDDPKLASKAVAWVADKFVEKTEE